MGRALGPARAGDPRRAVSRAAGRPFVIGVTGNIACGKSTVMRALAALGAATIDADLLYHELIAPGMPLNAALVRRFGSGIAATDGGIDRRALGEIVFRDPRALDDLERLTHPAIAAAVLDRVARSNAAIVAVDAVKLFEGGLERHCDVVWLVECEPEQQLARLMQRNNLTRDDALRRIAAQPPVGDKRSRAVAVIDNSGPVDETRAVVERLWRQLPILQH
jgi:dephospho-CoA kinase